MPYQMSRAVGTDKHSALAILCRFNQLNFAQMAQRLKQLRATYGLAVESVIALLMNSHGREIATTP